METVRFRFTAIIEWAVAAAAIVATVALGSFARREVSTVSAVTRVIAREAPVAVMTPPAAVPPGAVSVPMLVLNDGRAFQIGETVSEVLGRLGRNAQTGAPSVERAPHGERVTRTYNHGGIRFQFVFEPFDEGAEPRLAAIYR
ncbi:MAG TPA: hypothetical protein VIX63_09520 [Vicinamibacterales bacterium]